MGADRAAVRGLRDRLTRLQKPDGHGGEFVHPRDGSIDWPAVRRALDKVGYNGWATIEDGGLPLAEFARRFDLIEAGK